MYAEQLVIPQKQERVLLVVDVVGVGYERCRFDSTAANDGMFTYYIDASVVTDEALNANLESNMAVTYYDGTAPGVAISTSIAINSQLSSATFAYSGATTTRVTSISPFPVTITPTELLLLFVVRPLSYLDKHRAYPEL